MKSQSLAENQDAPSQSPSGSYSEDDTLYLLPVEGSDTQWYKNVLKKPLIRVKAGSAEAELKVVPVSDAKQVSPVVEKFRAKYGARDVKKYYSKSDGAVLAPIR